MTTDVVTMRASVLDAFRTKQPKRDLFMPLCFFDYFTDMPGYKEADDELEFRANFHEQLGMVFMDWCGGNAYSSQFDSSVKTSTVISDDGLQDVYTVETPVGTLTQKRERRLDLNAAFVVEPMIRTEDDLRAFKYMVEAETTVGTPEAARKWLDTVGGRGVAMQPGCDIPFHSLLYNFGPEKFLIMAMEGFSDAVKELFPIIRQRGLEKAQILADSPIEVILHQGSWDLGQISPKMYSEYYAPYLKEHTEILHSTGTLSGDHISGHDILPFADAIAESGMDFMYGINLTPDSAAGLRDLADKWQGQMLMCLGVDPMALWYNDIDESRRQFERIRDIFGDRKSIYATADAAIAGMPPEKLQMAVDVLTRPGE